MEPVRILLMPIILIHFQSSLLLQIEDEFDITVPAVEIIPSNSIHGSNVGK